MVTQMRGVDTRCWVFGSGFSYGYAVSFENKVGQSDYVCVVVLGSVGSVVERTSIGVCRCNRRDGIGFDKLAKTSVW